ncbi:MAG: zf-HC2 domain-containing protein [Actinomycetota bacterium]
MSGSNDLRCQEVVEIVTDYLEGAMSESDRIRFEEHLTICDGCTSYVQQMRETIRLAGMLTEEQIPKEQRAALIDAFRGWRER